MLTFIAKIFMYVRDHWKKLTSFKSKFDTWMEFRFNFVQLSLDKDRLAAPVFESITITIYMRHLWQQDCVNDSEKNCREE